MNQEKNIKLARIFNEMAYFYKYLGGNDRFRSLAYMKASKTIASLPEDIAIYWKNKSLDDLPGIGQSIAEKTNEFIRTGKIKKHEELKKMVPFEIMDMMKIKGFGPQSLKQIHDELKISTKSELIKAIEDGRIAGLKRFGQKKVENMKRGIKLHKVIEERMLLWDGLAAGETIVSWLKKLPEVLNAELAGSLRRRKETIGDIDVLIACEEKYRKKIADHFVAADFVKQILVKGDTKVSVLLMDSLRQVDLRLINKEEWGSALQYFTGSKDHNIHLRTIARAKGYKISEYGIFNLENDKKLAGLNEEDIYKKLGLQFIPPEIREDKGEIELSKLKMIPKLVSFEDIKGDLQMHSVWSDGTNSIDEIVTYVLKHFNYEYIVLTDHSKSSRVANGMDEKQVSKQLKEIELVNKKIGKDFIKKGIEVDILPDGSLDLSDEILSQLDWVTAAIHSNFSMDNTDRIVAACENKYVNVIGHPTGRLIGTREPYKLEMERVFEIAASTGTALEINASPQRMDLNDEYTFSAREKKIPLVISTDSHSFSNFDFMKLGVFIARRAWCKKEDILNSKSWSVLKLFRNKKNKHKEFAI
jgi:DNA polymerase (family 10)